MKVRKGVSQFKVWAIWYVYYNEKDEHVLSVSLSAKRELLEKVVVLTVIHVAATWGLTQIEQQQLDVTEVRRRIFFLMTDLKLDGLRN